MLALFTIHWKVIEKKCLRRRNLEVVDRRKESLLGINIPGKKNLEVKEALVEQESIEESDESDLDRLDEIDTLPSSSDNLSSHALPRKPHELSNTKLETETSSSEDDSAAIQGFRFIDRAVLSPIVRLLLCPMCKKNHVELDEDCYGKMGFASALFIKCTGKKCTFFEKFYSSSKVGTSQAFEVNRKIVLASRNIGVGHQGLVKFTAVMC